MASPKQREYKGKELTRAILEQDESKIFSLVKTRPSLDPVSIGDAIVAYGQMRADPRGQHITPLLVAVHVAQLELCRYLIDEGADVDSGYLHDMPPLCLALYYKHYHIASLLIKAGANVKLRDKENKTAMYHAICPDSPASIVEELLAAGAGKDDVVCRTGEYTPLTHAVFEGNVTVVELLLELSVNVTTASVDGPPLNIAIKKGNLEIVKLLIKHGAPLDCPQNDFPPPLFIAIQTGDVNILSEIIKTGADVNSIFTPIKYKNCYVKLPFITAFQHAIITNQFRAACMLFFEGADVNGVEPNKNRTALHIAVDTPIEIIQRMNQAQRINYGRVVRLLLELGADVNVDDDDEISPLIAACVRQNWIAIEEFIRFGTDVNCPSPIGSIFKIVTVHKVANLIELCLEFGADCTTDLGMGKFLLYHFALKTNDISVVIPFIKHGYPADDLIINTRVFLVKCPPGIFNLIGNQLEFSEGIKTNNHKKVLDALAKGAEPRGTTKDIRNPLHYSAAQRNTEILTTLLEHGVPPCFLDSDGLSALHIAARTGTIKAVKLLLRHGACYNYRPPGAATPKRMAEENVSAQADHKEVVDILVRISRFFNMVKRNNVKIIEQLNIILNEEKHEEKFLCFVNCTNSKGNTLMGEALSLGFVDIARKIMSLRLSIEEAK